MTTPCLQGSCSFVCTMVNAWHVESSILVHATHHLAPPGGYSYHYQCPRLMPIAHVVECRTGAREWRGWCIVSLYEEDTRSRCRAFHKGVIAHGAHAMSPSPAHTQHMLPRECGHPRRADTAFQPCRSTCTRDVWAKARAKKAVNVSHGTNAHYTTSCGPKSGLKCPPPA